MSIEGNLYLKMEQAIRSPSDINSFSFNLNENIFGLNKKRKLQADQLGLPISKHKSWNHRISPKPLEILQENKLLDDLTSRFSNHEAEEPSIYYVSEPVESAKDSNSFIGDTENDCSMSESSDAKFESNASKQWSSTAEDGAVYEVEDYDPCNYFDEIQEHQNLDAANVQEVDGEYGHGIGRYEPFRSLNKILHSNNTSPYIPSLSTGSSSVNQSDAESVRKPTIDQEFEDYFSTLML